MQTSNSQQDIAWLCQVIKADIDGSLDLFHQGVIEHKEVRSIYVRQFEAALFLWQAIQLSLTELDEGGWLTERVLKQYKATNLEDGRVHHAYKGLVENGLIIEAPRIDDKRLRVNASKVRKLLVSSGQQLPTPVSALNDLPGMAGSSKYKTQRLDLLGDD